MPSNAVRAWPLVISRYSSLRLGMVNVPCENTGDTFYADDGAERLSPIRCHVKSAMKRDCQSALITLVKRRMTDPL